MTIMAAYILACSLLLVGTIITGLWLYTLDKYEEKGFNRGYDKGSKYSTRSYNLGVTDGSLRGHNQGYENGYEVGFAFGRKEIVAKFKHVLEEDSGKDVE